MRTLLVLGVLSMSSFASAATALVMSCNGTLKSNGNDVYLSNDNDSLALYQSSTTDDYGTADTARGKIVAKKISLQKTSKADMYNVIDENGKTIVTLKHDGNPGNRYAQGSNGEATLNCSINQSFISYASPKTLGEFCANVRVPGAVKNLLKDSDNRLSFTNGPYGLQKGGVCWWHSMFERNAAYLAVFNPKSRKPDVNQAQAIIDAIRSGNQIVVVPGYKNLREFSTDYRSQILKTLEAWQIADGVFSFGWLRGLSGESEVSAPELRKIMDDTYQVVEVQKQAAFHMLQMPGVTAHAWLVVGMKKVANGYDLLVDDSNMLSSRVIQYRDGMTKIREYNAVPYLQTKYLRDTESMLIIERNYCSTVVSR